MTVERTDRRVPGAGPGRVAALGRPLPRALTAEYQRIYAETCPPGMASYMERYGVLARTLDVAFVHGHLYITPVPLAGPREPAADTATRRWCGCCRGCTRRSVVATGRPATPSRSDRGAP